jgi:hypothetical protein
MNFLLCEYEIVTKLLLYHFPLSLWENTLPVKKLREAKNLKKNSLVNTNGKKWCSCIMKEDNLCGEF